MGDFYKVIKPTTVIMDSEYVPDLELGRKLYGIGDSANTEDILKSIFENNGATEEDPQPMIKFLLYKIICVSYIVRKVTYPQGRPSKTSLNLYSLPKSEKGTWEEGPILEFFLGEIGKLKPQIVGWGNKAFDFNVMHQRALINKCIVPEYFIRPDKPWEGSDYHTKYSDYVVDLCDVICGFGSKTRSHLDEMARACGIPGKLGISGKDVCNLFYGGEYQRIIDYCNCDTVTTYLLWLETARMSTHIDEQQYELERALMHGIIIDRIESGEEYWRDFLAEWEYEPE